MAGCDSIFGGGWETRFVVDGTSTVGCGGTITAVGLVVEEIKGGGGIRVDGGGGGGIRVDGGGVGGESIDGGGVGSEIVDTEEIGSERVDGKGVERFDGKRVEGEGERLEGERVKNHAIPKTIPSNANAINTYAQTGSESFWSANTLLSLCFCVVGLFATTNFPVTLAVSQPILSQSLCTMATFCIVAASFVAATTICASTADMLMSVFFIAPRRLRN